MHQPQIKAITKLTYYNDSPENMLKIGNQYNNDVLILHSIHTGCCKSTGTMYMLCYITFKKSNNIFVS